MQISGFFSMTSFVLDFFDVDIARAQSPWVPIYTVYRDAAGGENITTTPQSLSWDTQVSENIEIQADGSNTNFDLSVWGHYLVMYSVPVRSTGGNNRSEIQSWLEINGSNASAYSYSSSYIRRADDDFEWYNEAAAIINVNSGDDINIQIQKTDSNSATMQRTPNRSWINILKLDDTWDYARLRPAAAQAITTSWSEVDLGAVDELDAWNFSVSGNDITLQAAGKYLVTYNVWTVITGTDRTNNEMRLTLDGVEVEATRSTAYARAQNGSFTGIASYVGIIEVWWTNQVLNLEVMRESSLQWTTNNTVPGKTGITITKLPDSADYLRVWEAWWGQDMSTAKTPVTFDTTIEQGTNLQHDSINTSEIDILSAGDYMLFHSIYNSRSDTSNTNRENPFLQWEIWGIPIGYGVSGSYNRHSNDGDGITNSSHSSAWLILPGLSSSDTLELTQVNEARNGTSTYTAGRMWIQWVSLTSLFSGSAYLSQPSYRWRDDSSDFDTNAWWLANENAAINDVEKNETLRLRMKVENPGNSAYLNSTQFELQWAEANWICNWGLSWNSISSSWDAWEMIDSAYISPNGETSSTVLLDNSGGNTHIQSEWYHAPNGLTNSSSGGIFTSGSQKEYEFSIQSTIYLKQESIYCFRLYDSLQNQALSVNNFPSLETASTPVILNNVWGEAGSISAPADGWWTTVTFAGGPYTTPVIVGRSNTHNDPAEALVFESRNLTSTTAQVRLCDSQASNATDCDTHGVETIWYIVVDAAQTSSVDWVEAGVFSADESFDTVGWSITTSYGESFSQIPYVFTSIQSTNGSSPIVTRVSASSISNFTGWICQQQWSEDACNGTHPTETFGWIAVDPSVNPFFRQMDIGTWVSTTPSDVWSTAVFSTSFVTTPIAISQTVTNNWGQDAQIDEIQSITTSGMEFRSCELDNDDDCDTHAIDDIRWMAIEQGVFADEYVLDKTHYRWYENNNANTPITPLAAENSKLNIIPWNRQVRLRMLIQNGEPEVPAWVLSLKLQYANSATCETAPSWTDVWSLWWGEDWLMYDNVWVTDWATLTNSLLFGWWHILQSYNESIPTISNPNTIPVNQWAEWDFSLRRNTLASGNQYCFRVVTDNDSEIEYSSYAIIDTTDTVLPVINSYTPDTDTLFPIWNFEITYNYSDADSGIDTDSDIITLQRWDGATWWANIAGTYISLDNISSTDALYNVTGLPYGRYQVGFQISDNAWNSAFEIHELYVDEVEFIISQAEVEIDTIFTDNTKYTSDDTLTVTVKTVGAAFDVVMEQTSDMSNAGEIIPDWDWSKGFWYEEAPFGSVNSFGSGVTIASEVRDLNINGEKYSYTYDLKYSILLDMFESYGAWDYQANLDFHIELDYN